MGCYARSPYPDRSHHPPNALARYRQTAIATCVRLAAVDPVCPAMPVASFASETDRASSEGTHSLRVS